MKWNHTRTHTHTKHLEGKQRHALDADALPLSICSRKMRKYKTERHTGEYRELGYPTTVLNSLSPSSLL